MSLILIGSRALQVRVPNLPRKIGKDFDYVATKDSFLKWKTDFGKKMNLQREEEKENKIILFGDLPVEFEIIQDGSSKLLEECVLKDPDTIETKFGLVPSLDFLFTLKDSHKYKKDSPHFWKTAMDYHFMKDCGAKIRPEWKEFSKLRRKETYNYSHPKLNVNKNDFFVDDFYVYDHDTIHESVKHLDKPAYVYFKKPNEEVMCDKGLFFEADEKVRLYSVLEESYVLALERSQIPHPGVLTPRQSFLVALSKVCSSITSGWWRKYAYDNIFNVLELYSDDYVDRFNRAKELGIIKPFNKEDS